MICTRDWVCLKKIAGGKGCALYGPSRCSIRCNRRCLRRCKKNVCKKVCCRRQTRKICVQYKKCYRKKLNYKVKKFRRHCKRVLKYRNRRQYRIVCKNKRICSRKCRIVRKCRNVCYTR
jgi:hypothetical protein